MKKWLNSESLSFLLILLVGLIFSFPFWSQGKIPFPSTYLVNNFPPWQYYYAMPVKNAAMPDIGSQIFPWRYLSLQSYKNKEWPIWNPYNFSGTPLLANFQSAPFHPANILFFILPTIEAWSLTILLQPVLAAIFTFLYLRELKISPPCALLASFAFAFCGFMVCWLAYGTLPWTILWLPLALLAVEKFFKGSKFSGLLLSFSLSLSLFSGHFQTSLYLLTTVFLYLFFRGKRINGLKKTLPLLVFFILGICLALPVLLPTWEFYQQSVRSEAFRVAEGIPLKYLITLVSPDFYGNPVTRNDWFGHYAEWSSYIGGLPLILAFYALMFHKKDFFLKFFGGLAALALLIAIRSPIQNLVVSLKIPVLSTSSFSRIIVLFSFSLAILSAFGFEQLKRDWQKKNVKKILFFFGSFSLVFLIIWVIILAGQFTFHGNIDTRHIAKRNFILPSLIFITSSLVILAGFIKHQWQKILIPILLLLAIFDLLRFAKKWMPFDPREYFYPQLEVIKFLQEKTASGERVFGNFGSELNTFAIPGAEGYDPLYIKRYGELITTASDGKIKTPSILTVLIDKNGQYTDKILNLLGAKYLLHAKGDGQNVWAFPFWQYPESFKLLWEDDQYQIFENKTSLARAFLIGDYQVAHQDQEVIDLMLSKKTDLSKIVILEKDPQITIEQCNNVTMEDNVKITSYTPNQVELSAESSCGKFLFLSDIFYPGWQAFVDQKETPILRANYVFRSVIIPPGQHQVVFRYLPPLFNIGLFASLASLGLIILISFWRKNESRPF